MTHSADLHRRRFLTTTVLACAAAPTLVRAARDWGSPPHYPDPDIQVLDKRFTFSLGNAGLERVATGMRWCEGPVYFRDLRCLLWSDVPNNRIMRWDEENGAVSIFRAPSNYANGNTRDNAGRLISCEQDTRRVTRTEHDGTISVLIDHYRGKPLNSPNDVVVSADGAVWFTDPGYGIQGNYESSQQRPFELPTNVYRLDPATGAATVVADDFVRPNGLAFSPDESLLYIIDSGLAFGGPSHIRVFNVERGRLRNGRVFAQFQPGTSDGVRIDVHGNLWCTYGWGDPREDGVRCYAANGDLIGKIHLPETVANLTFGGPKKNRLFICASTSIYSVYLNDAGAQKP
ncbi:MAG TPA: SMP-30/gluconolactonase/LRE family protein [Steroidobacteraceae bacterium]